MTISTCPEPWGGSEELWSRAVSILADSGHSVSIFKTVVDQEHPSIQHLKSLSCGVRDLERIHLPDNLLNLFLPARYQLTPIRKQLLFVALHLIARRPNLAIVSQGINFDGIHFGHLCRRLKVPYILICQKATDHFWPPDKSRKYMRDVFEGAEKCFFVSRHNQSLTEDQIGGQLANASVVRNPFLVTTDKPLSWPENSEGGFRLACVGRLYLAEKGQDLLLRVLACDKWKKRDLHISFFGQGSNREGLLALAKNLEVTNVSFPGYTNDVQGIWREHHALIMPSRCEGLPLALVEAMLCGRIGIVTKVGGNAEVIDDQVTGFLVAAPAEADVDNVLEKAWQRRDEWQAMGLLAARRIRELVPKDPATEFASQLLELERLARRSQSGQLEVRHTQPSASGETEAGVGMTASD